MKSNRKKQNIKRSNLIEFAAVALVLVFVNIIGNYIYTRIDLTSDKRFTLSDSTKKMLRGLDEPILFRVYLEGDELPADYRRFRNEIKNMLDQLRSYNRYVEYEFYSPNQLKDDERTQFYQQLVAKGITPVFADDDRDGVQKNQIVVPAMEVSYKGRETAVQLQNSNNPTESDINSSIENLENNFVSAIHRLMRPVKTRIAFLQGHGELATIDIYDIQRTLVEDYSVENVKLDKNITALTGRVQNTQDSSITIANKYDVVVIPKPVTTFTDEDLYVLDQYVMYGGKILWLVDALDADMDSLQNQPQTFATRLPTNLEQLLFNFGVRINPDLIMDYRCRGIPMMGNDNRMQMAPWYYFPTLIASSGHPIVRNLDVLKTDFVSSIDLIDNDIEKTVLLTTSDHVHIKNAPVNIQLTDAMVEVSDQLFNRSSLPVAVLLEGQFKSMFRSRLTERFTSLEEMGYKDHCDKPTQMIVISDGDMIRNGIAHNERGMFPYPLGYDRYTNYTFANKTFLLNAINYLAGDVDVIDARPRHIKMRRLDMKKIESQGKIYQYATLLIPLLAVGILAAVVLIWRRILYKSKKS